MKKALSILLLFTLTACYSVSKLEQPKYVTLKSEGKIEIREYKKYIAAETTMKGAEYDSMNDSFRIIAGYIFGKNVKSEKIEMTAPVTQASSEKIEMTAPVTQTGKDGEWKMQFMMPSKWTLETLPKPLDERVRFVEVPAKKFAVIKFSGFWNEKTFKKQQQKLLDYITTNKLETVGLPIKAFYNPPWTLPFLRRNEILIELKK
jgi:hypothetical protein